MRPRHPKPDANQKQITTDLRRLGFYVVDVSRWLASIDLFVWGWSPQGYRWTAWEIKTEQGILTEQQKKTVQAGYVKIARKTETIVAEYERLQ